MMMNTNNLVSLTEVNRDSSKVENTQEADDEDIMIISKRLIAKNRKAYEVLAK